MGKPGIGLSGSAAGMKSANVCELESPQREIRPDFVQNGFVETFMVPGDDSQTGKSPKLCCGRGKTPDSLPEQRAFRQSSTIFSPEPVSTACCLQTWYRLKIRTCRRTPCLRTECAGESPELLPVDPPQSNEDDKDTYDNERRISVLPGQFRHAGEVHAVPADQNRQRQKDGRDDG